MEMYLKAERGTEWAMKHRWSLGHNHLSGITAGKWLALLREVDFDLDWTYAHRAAFVSLMSVNNSFFAGIERLRFQKKIEATPVDEPPVFVLGHWRSGTTHLHNLLCLDDQFAYPNTYQVVNPLTFLTTEALNTRLFGWLLPKTRPMDNMAMSFAAPQEDELGLCMVCLKSLYMGISFPRHEPQFAKYLSFREAEPGARELFLDALKAFVKKLTFKYGKAIVLKSPSHTARIAMLLSLYPNARFVHIHRDPYTVFRSSRHYFDTATWYTYMQRPDRSRIDDEIIGRYVDLYDAFFEQRPAIPAGQFHEISFQQLEERPVDTMAEIYEGLHLAGFDRMRPRLEQAVQGLSGYQKNKHLALPEEERERIAKAWSKGFEAWGYPK